MEDFNLPSPERVALLKLLEGKMGLVTPYFWAACQICDLDALRNLLDLPFSALVALPSETSQMIRHWSAIPGVQSRPSSPKTPTPQKSSPLTPMQPSPSKRQKILDSPQPLPRDTIIKKRAEERDNFCCVLTGMKLIEVAHIYPHHSMKYKEEDKSAPRHRFWGHLRMFWPEEKVAAWEAKLFPDGIGEKGQEEVYNLISLAPHTHAMWERGLFALKPIPESESEDKKTLRVQFFWQEKGKVQYPRMSLTTTPTSTKGLEETAGAWLSTKEKKPIRSGDEFELQTDDPIGKPLPSFELLELQWFLHRIQGIAGAADVFPSFSEPDSDLGDEIWEENDENSEEDHDIPDLQLDKAADLSLLPPKPLSSLTKPFPLKLAYNDSLMHLKYYKKEAVDRAEDGRDVAM